MQVVRFDCPVFNCGISTLPDRRIPHRKWIRGQHWAALASAAQCCPLLFYFQQGILRSGRDYDQTNVLHFKSLS